MDELINKLANATVTYTGARGAAKADRNRAAARYYEQQIKDAGGDVPSADELRRRGVFNGDGSV